MATDPIVVGRFSPPDFKVVSQRLERAGVEFEAVCDTSAPAINDGGFFSERTTITVVVQSEKAALAAATVVDEWCLEVGRVKRENS